MREFNKTLLATDFVRRFFDEEKSSALCKVCPNFNVLWSCPPYDTKFDFSKYSNVKIILRRFDVSGSFDTDYLPARRNFDAYLLALEKIKPSSLAFFAGSCIGCGLIRCSRKDNVDCPRKNLLRLSLESVGFDVSKISKELFGIDIQWQQNNTTPNFLTLVACLWF